MTKQQQAKATKLIVLVRYFIKKSYTATDGTVYKKGSVVCLVRNGEGREYYTTLNRNKQHTCKCPHVPSEKCPECYHILTLKAIENARVQSARKLHQDVQTFLDNEREQAKTGAQSIERRLATAGFMRK